MQQLFTFSTARQGDDEYDPQVQRLLPRCGSLHPHLLEVPHLVRLQQQVWVLYWLDFSQTEEVQLKSTKHCIRVSVFPRQKRAPNMPKDCVACVILPRFVVSLSLILCWDLLKADQFISGGFEGVVDWMVHSGMGCKYARICVRMFHLVDLSSSK